MGIDELQLFLKEGEGLTIEFKESFSSKLDKDHVRTITLFVILGTYLIINQQVTATSRIFKVIMQVQLYY